MTNPDITIDSYRAYYASSSPMGDDQQDAIDEITDCFERFCNLADLKHSGSWYYCYPCSGMHVEYNAGRYGDGTIEGWEPVTLNESNVRTDEYACWDAKFIEKYNEHYPRLRQVWEWIDRKIWHLDRCPQYDWWDYEHEGYVHRKDRIIDERLQRVIDYYSDLVDKLCEDIAKMYEKAMYDACEYYETEEAAREWVDANEGVPISRDMLNDTIRRFGLGLYVTDEQYERVCELLANYMDATSKYTLNEQEVGLAMKLIAA